MNCKGLKGVKKGLKGSLGLLVYTGRALGRVKSRLGGTGRTLTSLYWFILVYTGLYQSILVGAGSYTSILVLEFWVNWCFSGSEPQIPKP